MPMISMLFASPMVLAQAAQDDADLMDGVSLAVVGMVVVFAALALVGVMIGLLKIMAAVESATAAAEAATNAAKAATAAADEAGRRVAAATQAPPPAPPTPAPAPAPTQPVPQPEGPPAPAQALGGVDARTLAIIAAAAASIVGGRVRVRNVEFIDRQGSGSWGRYGRLGIQTSHNLQNRNR